MEFFWGDIFGIGGIGFLYGDGWGKLAAHLIVFTILLFAIIGVIATLKAIFFKPKKDSGFKYFK